MNTILNIAFHATIYLGGNSVQIRPLDFSEQFQFHHRAELYRCSIIYVNASLLEFFLICFISNAIITIPILVAYSIHGCINRINS